MNIEIARTYENQTAKMERLMELFKARMVLKQVVSDGIKQSKKKKKGGGKENSTAIVEKKAGLNAIK